MSKSVFFDCCNFLDFWKIAPWNGLLLLWQLLLTGYEDVSFVQHHIKTKHLIFAELEEVRQIIE